MHTFAKPKLASVPKRVTAPVVIRKPGKELAGLAYDAINSPGRPLDSSTQLSMEKKLGRSFTSVRVHDNSIANKSAKMLGAEAYTLGNDIVFNRSMPGFDIRSNAKLLTHELVHVLQSGTVAPPITAATPLRLSKSSDEAEQEADRISGLPENSTLPQPTQRVGPGTLMRKLLSIEKDFHDPNFCYKPGVPRDSTHPDLKKVVAVMQAQIITPDNCDGKLTLRTSVLKSGWGAAVANFESFGGGASQGIFEGIKRNEDAERVDYEERFALNTCHAQFTRCHLITHSEGDAKYIFGKARYQPNIYATSTAIGTLFHDKTPQPALEVNPCAGVSRDPC